MLKATLCGAVMAASMFLAIPVKAQVTATGPTTNLLNVKFTGTVTNDVTNSIRIRQPDGTTTRYSGPVPEYPYKQGDPVTISFQTAVPNKNFYSSPAYTGQIASDGIYRIGVKTRANGVTDGPGFVSAVDISGPVRTESSSLAGPLAVRGITIVYDSIKDIYSLDLGTDGWRIVPLDAPTYTYDATTGALLPRSSACIGPQCESSGIGLTGNANSASIGWLVNQGGAIPIADASEPSVIGFMDAIGLSGLFNFPIFGSGNGGGGPVDVPEPSMMLLFGAGAMTVMRRRRKVRG